VHPHVADDGSAPRIRPRRPDERLPGRRRPAADAAVDAPDGREVVADADSRARPGALRDGRRRGEARRGGDEAAGASRGAPTARRTSTVKQRGGARVAKWGKVE